MYNEIGIPFCVDAARKVVDKCDELILYRSRVNDKDDFARLVIQNLFDDSSIDLLSLRPKFDAVHAEALNRLNGLIGFESSVFKTIYTNDNLFEEFIKLFINHAINSKVDASIVVESIYMWLLLEYLAYILPTDEAKINLVKNSNWVSAPMNPISSVSSVSSPRRLLRPEVLAASYPLEHVAMQSVSLRSLYPRLLQFVSSCLKYLASLNNWPSIAQCEILKTIISHYYNFIILDTDDADFSSLKLVLVKNGLFTNVLKIFVERILLNWPLSNSYIRLVELWISLTYHRSFESKKNQKQELFMSTSTCNFIGYFQIVIERILDTDCITIFRSYVLDFLEEKIFSRDSNFPNLFNQFGIPIADYLEMILKKLTSFQNEQNLESGFFANIAYLFSSQFNEIDLEVIQYHINQISDNLNFVKSLTESSIFNNTSNNPSYLTSISSPSTSSVLLANSSFSSDFNSFRQRNLFKTVNEQKKQKESDQIPDHEVDPWTKMLFLTPVGRTQVINRQRRFNFKQCSKQITQTFPQISQWEIKFLVRYLHNLSVKWSNCWLVRYMRQHSHDSLITRKIADVMLCAPSPPHYVPVFSKYVPVHSQRLNLRIFANVSVLIVIYIFFHIMFLILIRIFY